MIAVHRALFSFLLGLVHSQYSIADDNVVVAGERVGLITAEVGEDRLAALYGNENVSRRIRSWGDGGFRCATVVFNGTAKEVTIFWSDDVQVYEGLESVEERERCNRVATRRTPHSLLLRSDRARNPRESGTFWRTPEGVFAGMTLLDLERVNGAPIEFEASASCSDGAILDINHGKLQKVKRLLTYSRFRYPIDDVEAFKQGATISSRILSEQSKKRIFLESMEVTLQSPTE